MHAKPNYSARQIKALQRDRQRRTEATAMDQLDAVVRQDAASNAVIRQWLARLG